MKYTRPLLIAIIAIIPMSILFSVTSNAGWVILSFSVYAILGTLIGFVLAPLFLWGYKKVIGRHHIFAIHEEEPPEKFKSTFMGFFPALMATNFTLSLIFNPAIMAFPMFQDYYLEWSGIIFLFFNLGAYLQVPAFALFSAAWIIYDSGIVALNKGDVGNVSASIDLQGVGKWYLSFLKGYAGISVILSLYQFTFDFLAQYGSEVHYSAVIFLFILPIILMFWVLPAIILFDATYGSRRRFILKIGEKIGIKHEFDLTIVKTDNGPE
ncbi:MAG: hypothetical protein ACTSSE_09135 [Candidatus Thorarchaeota archaeon]